MPLLMTLRTRLLLVVLLVFTASCDGTDPNGDNGDDFDRSAMLEHIGEDIILPAYTSLQEAVDALDASAAAFAADPETLADARDALKTARLAWQDANLFQFGPAESVTLRASLNTYPVDEEQIEENVESGTYTLGTIANRAAVGFPAIGYLLYGESDEAVLAAFTDGAHAPRTRRAPR